MRVQTGNQTALPFLQETLVLRWERLEYRFLPMSAYQALVLPRVRFGEPPRTGLQVAQRYRISQMSMGE